jgi:hypothetical protein
MLQRPSARYCGCPPRGPAGAYGRSLVRQPGGNRSAPLRRGEQRWRPATLRSGGRGRSVSALDRGIRPREAFRSPYPTGSQDGGRRPGRAASPAATRNVNSGQPCWRHDATTVRSRSANRLPSSLSAPKLLFRHRTAGRRARSDPLLVGSTPSTRAKVHSDGHHCWSCRHSPAAHNISHDGAGGGGPAPGDGGGGRQRRVAGAAVRYGDERAH